MTDCFKCMLCQGKLKRLTNLLICYLCEQAYYINDEQQLDYYCNLGEIIPLTRKQRVLANKTEDM